MTPNKTFIEITNKDIYDKLEEVCNHVIVTNGTVKLNKLYSRAAFIISVIGISVITGVNLVSIFS